MSKIAEPDEDVDWLGRACELVAEGNGSTAIARASNQCKLLIEVYDLREKEKDVQANYADIIRGWSELWNNSDAPPEALAAAGHSDLTPSSAFLEAINKFTKKPLPIASTFEKVMQKVIYTLDPGELEKVNLIGSEMKAVGKIPSGAHSVCLAAQVFNDLKTASGGCRQGHHKQYRRRHRSSQSNPRPRERLAEATGVHHHREGSYRLLVIVSGVAH